MFDRIDWVISKPSSEVFEGGIAACVNQARFGGRIIAHANAVAGALAVPATVLHVLEPSTALGGLPDPIEWERQREDRTALVRGYLVRPVQNEGAAPSQLTDAGRMESELLEGHPAEQICRWVDERGANLIVIGASETRAKQSPHLGATVRELMDRAPGSILLIPHSEDQEDRVIYHRIMVALDGSCRAETALEIATRVAEAHDSELLPVHVVAAPEMTCEGPLEADDIDLCDKLVCRNEKAVSSYLDRIRARIASQGVLVRTLVVRDNNVRGRLLKIAKSENVDLMVLSADGHGGRTEPFQGSVVSSLITHLPVPALVVNTKRPHRTSPFPLSQQSAMRLPNRALQ